MAATDEVARGPTAHGFSRAHGLPCWRLLSVASNTGTMPGSHDPTTMRATLKTRMAAKMKRPMMGTLRKWQ